MYAIIESGGKQHKLSAGDTVKLESLGVEAGGEVSFNPLMVVDGDKVWTGKDVDGFKVTARVTGEGKHRKILVFHKKRRKQYKKLFGHRQPFTKVEILNIQKVKSE